MNSHARGIHSLCIYILFIVLTVLAISMTVFAEDSPLVKTVDSSDIPLVLIYDSDNAFLSCADSLRISNVNGSHYLFLPANITADSLTYVYNGSFLMFDEATGSLVSRGTSFRPLYQDGKLHFYEYSQNLKTYYHYTVQVMNGSNIPVISISLDDGDYGFYRVGRSKSANAPGTVRVTDDAGNTVFYGRMPKFSSRGNTSFSSSNNAARKISYNFNLSRDCELIEGAGAIKKWTLLCVRNSTQIKFDPTGLSYMMPFDLNNDLLADGNKYGLGHCYADLYVNGEYRGVYILTERMNMNGAFELNDQDDYEGAPQDYGKSQSKRVMMDDDFSIRTKIQEYRYDPRTVLSETDDITGGYILEIQYDGYNGYGFMTSRGLPISIKHPSNPSIEQVRYIAEYVQNFENAIFSQNGCNDLGIHYTEYLDLESAASQILISGFFGNWELFRTSTYISKQADGDSVSKLVFGPTWDFESGIAAFADHTMFSCFHFYNDPQQPLWIEQLWLKGEFMTVAHRIAGRMSEYLHMSLSEAPDETGRFLKLADTVSASEQMNWIRWEMDTSFEQQSSAMLEAIRRRIDEWDEWWNIKNYLCGVSAYPCEPINSEEGVELTAQSNGNTFDDGTIWYQLDSLAAEPQLAGYGNTYRLPAEALLSIPEDADPESYRSQYFYAECTGPNNMYCYYALSGVSSMTSIPMTSNLIHVFLPIDSSDPNSPDEPVKQQFGILSSGTFWFFGAILVFALVDILITRKSRTKNYP